MNTKPLKLIAGIALITAALYVSYTSSYFQDEEKSENNVFQAGTLDLVINEPANAVWTAENWLPGDEVEGEIEFENTGNIPIESLLMEVEIE